MFKLYMSNKICAKIMIKSYESSQFDYQNNNLSYKQMNLIDECFNFNKSDLLIKKMHQAVYP